MLRLLRYLFTGDAHKHTWVKERDLIDDLGDCWGVLQQCKHCGKLKTFKIN